MSGAVLTILMLLHAVMWLVQLAFNAQTGAGQCGVATFACGSGVLENLLSVPNELSGAGDSALGGVPVVGAVGRLHRGQHQPVEVPLGGHPGLALLRVHLAHRRRRGDRPDGPDHQRRPGLPVHRGGPPDGHQHHPEVMSQR